MTGWGLFEYLRAQDSKATQIRGTCSPSTRRPKESGLEVLDLMDVSQVAAFLQEFQPELVLHCAAICKVEKCEHHRDYAWDVNVGGTKNILQALDPSARLVYCSSDHVFSGDGGPYHENSEPDPISYYGQTRVEAEGLVLAARPDALVIRVPLCVGPSYNGRSGHMDWLKHRHSKALPMTIVSDEFRSALVLEAAAERIYLMACSPLSGLRHLHANRVVSRPELAEHLTHRLGLSVQLEFQNRSERRVPHLGKVTLTTVFEDAFSAALPSAVTKEELRRP